MEDTHGEYGHAREKFHDAVVALVGPQNQRVRLVEAMWSLALISDPDEYEKYIPDEMVRDLRKFMQKMTAVQGTGGTAPATIDSMRDDAVNDAAKKIVGFYRTVCRYKRPGK